MLSLTEIQKNYPENLQGFRNFILREYLQHKILQFIFDSPYMELIAFLGGTCLRIVHGNSRFSEDLDFDNFGLTEQTFGKIADYVGDRLSREGYKVEMKTVY